MLFGDAIGNDSSSARRERKRIRPDTWNVRVCKTPPRLSSLFRFECRISGRPTDDVGGADRPARADRRHAFAELAGIGQAGRRLESVHASAAEPNIHLGRRLHGRAIARPDGGFDWRHVCKPGQRIGQFSDLRFSGLGQRHRAPPANWPGWRRPSTSPSCPSNTRRIHLLQRARCLGKSGICRILGKRAARWGRTRTFCRPGAGALGQGVVIGVVDSGVYGAHPDLAPNYRPDLSYNFLESTPDATPPAPLAPEDNHGTNVAGVAAGSGLTPDGTVGVAPQAQIAGIRAIGGPITSQTLAQCSNCTTSKSAFTTTVGDR